MVLDQAMELLNKQGSLLDVPILQAFLLVLIYEIVPLFLMDDEYKHILRLHHPSTAPVQM